MKRVSFKAVKRLIEAGYSKEEAIILAETRLIKKDNNVRSK